MYSHPEKQAKQRKLTNLVKITTQISKLAPSSQSFRYSLVKKVWKFFYSFFLTRILIKFDFFFFFLEYYVLLRFIGEDFNITSPPFEHSDAKVWHVCSCEKIEKRAFLKLYTYTTLQPCSRISHFKFPVFLWLQQNVLCVTESADLARGGGGGCTNTNIWNMFSFYLIHLKTLNSKESKRRVEKQL